MNAPDLTNVNAAIDAARAARERFRRTPAEDPQRREALQARHDALSAAWTTDHQRYVRSLPRSAAAVDPDPVRQAGHARRAELAALRKALSPTAGTPRKRPPVTISANVWGVVGESRSLIEETRKRHNRARSLFGRGSIAQRRGGRGYYTSMHKMNAEAAKLLVKVERMRTKLTTWHRRYERQRRDSAKSDATAESIEGLVLLERDALNELAAELRESVRRTKPLTEDELRAAGWKRQTWSHQNVEGRLTDFVGRHNRLPTKRELLADPTLPHYTTLVRLYGPQPLTTLGTLLVSTVTSEEGSA